MALLKGATYRLKEFRCGNYLDAYIYPVYPTSRLPGQCRRRKRRPTRAVQKKLNRHRAEERMTRLIHANFSDADLAVTLDYAVNPLCKEDALHDLKKFLRRVRYRYRKLGVELKYIWALEISKKGRYHFHLILSGGMDRDELEQLWGHGWANTKRLQFDEHGLSALAKYITKSHRHEDEVRTTYRSYNHSKNLIDPPPKISDTKVRSRRRAAALAEEDTNAWLELFPEYVLTDIRPFCSDEYGSVFIFARLRREEPGEKKRRKKERCT